MPCKIARRAEKSFTHRHLCEFTGLDMEMAIERHYSEAMDVVDRLFVYMFNGLNARCSARSPPCRHAAPCHCCEGGFPPCSTFDAAQLRALLLPQWVIPL